MINQGSICCKWFTVPCQEKDSRRMEFGTMLVEALPATQKKELR